jgi:signal transduction histidine kinase
LRMAAMIAVSGPDSAPRITLLATHAALEYWMHSSRVAGRLDVPLLRWFAPPVLSTPDATRRAYALWIVSWPFLAVVTVTLAAAVLVQPETLERRAVTVAATAALVAVLHELNRRGRTALAGRLLVIGLTVLVTQRAWNTGGIHAPVHVFYTLFIVMAGALLDRRAAVGVALLCVAGAVCLTLAQLTGWLPPPDGARPALASFAFVLLAIGLALVVQMLFVHGPESDASRSADWLRMLVHDMRSPLTVVMVRLGVVREEVSGSAARAIDTTLRDIRELNQLTNNMLDVSRIEAGKLPIVRVRADVVSIAQRVVHSLATLDPARDLTLTGVRTAMCHCDPELMKRVIENLVSNAMKHTPPSGRIRVHVMTAAGGVRIAVHDDGPGIPAGSQGRVFEQFGSASLRTTTGDHSAGLGLAFCKLAVELHGGAIRVRNTEPAGCVFLVDIPRDVGSVRPEARQPS